MGSRKVNTEGIDEELLLASIGRRTGRDTAPRTGSTRSCTDRRGHRRTGTISCATRNTGKSAEGSGRRKRQDEDYNELFLRRNEIKTRQCVYISRDVHGKILRIVNDIAGGKSQ